jgi:hypothetical protein
VYALETIFEIGAHATLRLEQPSEIFASILLLAAKEVATANGKDYTAT